MMKPEGQQVVGGRRYTSEGRLANVLYLTCPFTKVSIYAQLRGGVGSGYAILLVLPVTVLECPCF